MLLALTVEGPQLTAKCSKLETRRRQTACRFLKTQNCQPTALDCFKSLSMREHHSMREGVHGLGSVWFVIAFLCFVS